MYKPFYILIFISSFFVTSIAYSQTRELDSLKVIYLQQKDDSVKANNLVVFAQQQMGEAQNSGNWDEAIFWIYKALDLSKKVNFQFGIGRSFWMLGRCWTNKGNYTESIKYYNEAINLSNKNGNLRLRQASSYYIAENYMLLGNYQQALKSYLFSFDVAKQLPNKVVAERLHLTISNIYLKLNKFQEALHWAKQPADDPDVFYEGEIPMHFATIHLALQNKSEALKYLYLAIEAFKVRLQRKPEIDYKGVLGPWLIEYGDAYYKIGQLTNGDESRQAYNKAVDYLQKGLPMIEEGSAGKESLMNAYYLLKQACEANNDYENALKYTNRYIHIKDSIYSKQNYLKFANLQIDYETEKASLAMRAQREKEIIQEAAYRERLLAQQRLEQENLFSEETIANERKMAEVELKQQLALTKEKAKYEGELALGRANEAKMQAEKARQNNMLQMGLGLLFVTSLFTVLFVRQRQLKMRAVEKAESIHKMAELEMQSLRSQLNPHFMFNSLNSIQELILLEENDKSHVYLARFSKLLRMLLDNAEKPFIPLQKELEFLQLYLGLENLRVPDLKYAISVDPQVNTEEVMIPNMILQPYIENAIWHGLSYKEGDRQLQLNICRHNGSVIYEIEDNGVGRKKAEEMKSMFRQKHKSKGMELLDKRFKLLSEEYNSDIKTNIQDVVKDKEVGGTLVTIEVPLMLSMQLQN